jgi:hypothetical protein
MEKYLIFRNEKRLYENVFMVVKRTDLLVKDIGNYLSDDLGISTNGTLSRC